MRINMNQSIKDWEGNEIVLPKSLDSDEKESLILRHVCLNCLGAVHEDEKNLSGEEKFKRNGIAMNIVNSKNGVVDLSSEQISELKKLIGKLYGPVVVGSTWNMLENPDSKLEVLK